VNPPAVSSFGEKKYPELSGTAGQNDCYGGKGFSGLLYGALYQQQLTEKTIKHL
jgi:hypothetical protein